MWEWGDGQERKLCVKMRATKEKRRRTTAYKTKGETKEKMGSKVNSYEKDTQKQWAKDGEEELKKKRKRFP